MQLARPDSPPAGTQRWRELLFLHWTFPQDVLRALVPAELELDPWTDGLAYVGAVPFLMRDVRPRWLPRLFAFDFLELNIRTYVRYRDRPGVYFFSLDASSWLAVKAARWGWGLPYFHATMASTHDGDVVTFDARRRDRAAPAHHVRFRPGTRLGPSQPGTLAYFLLERYLLFTVKAGQVFEGQVHHVPYPAQEVEVFGLTDGLVAASGLPDPGRQPDVAHYAAGVDVEAFGPWPVSRILPP